MSGPSSYSSLLRRSKLAGFSPQIDQVYTASSANRARANYGLKRPLPALSPAAGARSPFVRITALDSPERRTSYRRATREQQYTRKWLEVDAGLASEALVDRSSFNYAYGTGGAGDLQRKWDRLPVQSRFVAPGAPGAVRPLDQLTSSRSAPAAVPNFFALTPSKFERFLGELGSRRNEFREFVLAEAKKLSDQTGGAVAGLDETEFDLYAHAQRNPLELTRLVERFLRRSSSSASASSALSSLPHMHVHPTLALQYATPTPLESALAAPVPGRLLGPAPDGSSRPGNFNRSRWNNRPDVYASVLSQIAPVPAASTGGAAETNFFPDVEGHRSNVPGRAHFRLSPTVNPVPYANQTAITLTKVRLGSHEFRPPTAEYEPALLKLRSVRLNPTVVSAAAGGSAGGPAFGSSTPGPAARPGSPAYSGALPRDLAGSSSSSSSSSGLKPQSLSDLIVGRNALSSARSREMAARRQQQQQHNRRPSRSPEEQAQWLEKRERYLGAGAGARGAGGAGGGKRKKQGQQGRAEKTKQLMAALDALLVEK